MKSTSKNQLLRGCHSEPQVKNPVKSTGSFTSFRMTSQENGVFRGALKTFWILIFGFVAMLQSQPVRAQATQFYLEDTIHKQWKVRIYVVGDAQAKAQVQEGMYYAVDHARVALDKLDAENPSSELSVVNKWKGKGNYMVSPELASAIADGVEVADVTRGVFNPLSGGSQGSYKDIKVSRKSNELKIKRDNVAIDLQSILFGFLADLMANDLTNAGWKNCFIKLGDTYVVRGNDTAGPWKIPVASPADKLAKRVFLYRVAADIGAATVTQKQVPQLKTATDLESVTIFEPSAAKAQGLAAAIYAMGSFEGRKFLEKNRNLRAVFAASDGTFINIPEFKQNP